MRNFTRELRAALAGPPKITQSDFAQRSGIERTKLNRILSDFTQASRDDLDAILAAFPDKAEETKMRLVNAFVKDLISYGAMMHLKVKGADKIAILPDGFSPQVLTALRKLVQSSRRLDAEPIILSLCKALSD
jgi:transcriptional regulator with XRE-family HTH domain